jgi:hypothetical protein
MPRGIPRNRANGGKLTKMEGVRRALAELGGYDASPKDIQSFLKSRFGINMDTAMISNYKSALKGASKSSMIRKPVGRPAGSTSARDITLDDVRVVKDVVDKLGADKVRQLAAVLGR